MTLDRDSPAVIWWSRRDGTRGWYYRAIAEVCQAIGAHLNSQRAEPVSLDEIDEFVRSRSRSELYEALANSNDPEIRFASVHLHPENRATGNAIWSAVGDAARGEWP